MNPWQLIPRGTLERFSITEELDGFSGSIPGYPVRRWFTLGRVSLAIQVLVLCAAFIPSILKVDTESVDRIVFPMVVLFGIMILKARNQGSLGVSRLMARVLPRNTVKQSKALPFVISAQRLTLGSTVIAFDQIVFLRLTAPRESSSYVWIQVFVRSGKEYRWKVGQSHLQDVQWFIEYIRTASEALNDGMTPKALEQLRSVEFEGAR